MATPAASPESEELIHHVVYRVTVDGRDAWLRAECVALEPVDGWIDLPAPSFHELESVVRACIPASGDASPAVANALAAALLAALPRVQARAPECELRAMRPGAAPGFGAWAEPAVLTAAVALPRPASITVAVWPVAPSLRVAAAPGEPAVGGAPWIYGELTWNEFWHEDQRGRPLIPGVTLAYSDGVVTRSGEPAGNSPFVVSGPVDADGATTITLRSDDGWTITLGFIPDPDDAEGPRLVRYGLLLSTAVRRPPRFELGGDGFRLHDHGERPPTGDGDTGDGRLLRRAVGGIGVALLLTWLIFRLH